MGNFRSKYSTFLQKKPLAVRDGRAAGSVSANCASRKAPGDARHPYPKAAAASTPKAAEGMGYRLPGFGIEAAEVAGTYERARMMSRTSTSTEYTSPSLVVVEWADTSRANSSIVMVLWYTGVA